MSQLSQMQIRTNNSQTVSAKRAVAVAVLVGACSVLFLVQVPSAFANPCLANPCTVVLTPTIVDGNNEVFYRDINNLNNATATVSLDRSRYSIGQTAKLTIHDDEVNFDVSSKDNLSVGVTSGTDPLGIVVKLTENDVNSGIFVGTFQLTTEPSSENLLHVGVRDSINISYQPQPYTGRFKAVLNDVVTGGTAELSDFIIDDPDFPGAECFDPVIHPVNFNLIGVVLSRDGYAVTISYANGLIGTVNEPELLNMYYKPVSGGWQIITHNAFVDPGAHDLDAMTITSNPAKLGLPPITESGLFVIGFDNGCFGGGSGGLVRPGLIVNLLAGLGFGGAGGLDRSPPSLQFGTPTNTQDGFGGILVNDDNNNTFPLVINGKGYYLPAFSTFIKPVQVNTGQDVDLTLTFLESTGVEHFALHFVNENNDEMSDADAVITFDKGTVTKSDPDGILSDDITFSTSKEGNKYSFNFGFSFDEPTNRHLMITAWDNNKNSGNTKVFNAFSVSGEPIPDEGTNHMIYLDLGAYFITADGIFAAGEKPHAAAQPVIQYDYPDSVGRTERHDGIIYVQIANEKARAGQVMSEQFNLDTQTFVANDEVKPFDKPRRASELSLSTVGHKIRDFTLSPEENEKLIKELTWKEHLKAQKILDSLYSKHH